MEENQNDRRQTGRIRMHRPTVRCSKTHPNTLVFSSGVFIQSILPSFLHVYISSVFFIIYIFYYSLFCPTVT